MAGPAQKNLSFSAAREPPEYVLRRYPTACVGCRVCAIPLQPSAGWPRAADLARGESI